MECDIWVFAALFILFSIGLEVCPDMIKRTQNHICHVMGTPSRRWFWWIVYGSFCQFRHLQDDNI
jgi:hypothetical protein